MEFPTTLSVNAYAGPDIPMTAPVGTAPEQLGTRQLLDKSFRLLDAHAEETDRRKWRATDIGWGLVLPENETITEADRARGADAPAAIRRLLNDRVDAPIFRYIPAQNGFLRVYYRNGERRDLQLTSAAERGVGVGQLPYYLLICASPQAIPWRVQYNLNQSCYVGRLDLDETGLEHYVTALLSDWAEMDCHADQPLVWSVDFGGGDITTLMRQVIAEPVAAQLVQDTDFGTKTTKLIASDATGSRLIETLAAKQPALIVSTSHGMTGPSSDPELMLAQLGVLVDQNHTLVNLDTLLQRWSPCGAIWYAHACCSAGSDAASSYTGLLASGSSVDSTLKAVAALGSHTAPLPTRLLSAERPLRAFIGHVEPTFDWTLKQPLNNQVLTRTIREGLYNHLYNAKREPVGMAFRACYANVGELFGLWKNAQDDAASADLVKSKQAAFLALNFQLTALDRRSMVILGDPTTCLPRLASSQAEVIRA